MNNILKVLFISFMIVTVGFTKDKDNNEKEIDNKTFDNKKAYSKKEFDKLVYSEVEKRLKRFKKGNVVDFSMELLKKEDNLKIEEIKLVKKNEELQMNIKDFELKLESFSQEQKKIIGCITDAQNKENKRIGHMVDVISGMKPANAAEILSVQDIEISVKILDQLDAIKVSKIFNLMDKEISARLQKQYMTMKR